MAAVKKPREPVISDMSASRSWSGTIDIGDGTTLPVTVWTYAESPEVNEPVDLVDRKNGVTLYGYIYETNNDDYSTIVMVNSTTPEGRYDVTPPRVFVKGGTECRHRRDSDEDRGVGVEAMQVPGACVSAVKQQGKDFNRDLLTLEQEGQVEAMIHPLPDDTVIDAIANKIVTEWDDPDVARPAIMFEHGDPDDVVLARRYLELRGNNGSIRQTDVARPADTEAEQE